jgi:hypothetical protein
VHTDFRQQRTYPPREQSSNGDVPYEPNYYQIQAVGMRQRKAARAQLVMTVLFRNETARSTGREANFMFFPLSERPAISVEQEKQNAMKYGPPAATARRTI